jgi:hypothetical protein
MSTWQAFYSGLATEARQRARAASDPGVKAAFEKVAVDWSELAEWVRRRHVFDDATDLYQAHP